jgi:hypothetical protein
MADSESTTANSVGATPIATSDVSSPISHQNRLLTVAGCATMGSTGPVAHIRIMGRWLEQAGFTIGTRVNVEVSSGRLLISLLPEPPDPEPHLSPRSRKLADSARRQASKHRMATISEELLSGNYGARALDALAVRAE